MLIPLIGNLVSHGNFKHTSRKRNYQTEVNLFVNTWLPRYTWHTADRIVFLFASAVPNTEPGIEKVLTK